MGNDRIGQDKLTRSSRWVARIWSVVVIVVALIIFLGEVLFPHTEGPVPLLEYLIPFTLLLGVLGLALAWRWEVIGGAITIVSVLVNLTVYVLTGRTAVVAVAIILTPIAIPGILFLVCGFLSRGENLAASA